MVNSNLLCGQLILVNYELFWASCFFLGFLYDILLLNIPRNVEEFVTCKPFVFLTQAFIIALNLYVSSLWTKCQNGESLNGLNGKCFAWQFHDILGFTLNAFKLMRM